MGRMKKEPRHFESLIGRDLVSSQQSELALHFEMSEQSWIAEVAVAKFNHLMSEFELSHGIERVMPLHLVVKYCGKILQVPLLNSEWALSLSKDRSFKHHLPKVLDSALTIFRSANPDATLTDVHRYINRRALIPRWAVGECKRTKMPASAKLVNPKTLAVCPVPSPSLNNVTISSEVQAAMLDFLTSEVGVGSAVAMSMLKFLAVKREQYCPHLSTLETGQIIWLTLSIAKEKTPSCQFGRRVLRPIRLTLYKEKEFSDSTDTLEGLNRIQMEQCARVLVEAYLQGALLPQVELSLLFLRSYSVMASLSNAYMNIHNVILPTPGTILDSGTAMTHKNIIVEYSVSGLMTKEIARRTYHAPESVDSYLKVFQSVLILYLYDMPASLMARVTGRGESLVNEYILLAKKFFPNRVEIKSYLAKHGLKIG